MPLDAENLNPTDRAILDELREGRSTPAYIAEEYEYTSGNVRNRITHLASHGHVEAIGGGMYRLLTDPREGGEADGPTPDERTRETPRVDAGTARRALEDLEAALERGDRPEARAALQRARDALETGG